MKMKKLIPFLLLLFLCVSYSSCSKDDVIDGMGKRDYSEICKDVSKIDHAILEHFNQCESLEDLKKHADAIKAINGVEDVYFNEPTTMFVKIKDFRTVSYSFYPESEDGTIIQMQKSIANRIKAINQSQNEDKVYSQQDKVEMSVLIVNQQSQEDRDFQNNTLIPGIQDRFTKAGFQRPRIENSPDAEFFRNGIFDCDYLFLLTHGHYDPVQKLHWVATSEVVPRDRNNDIDPSFLEKFQNYSEDEYSFDFSAGNRNVVIVSERFIDNSSRQFKHPGKAVVFNTSCESMQGPSEADSIDNSLAEVFVNRGAGAYLGYDQTNCAGPEGGFEFWDRLLSGMSIKGAYDDLSFRVRHDYCVEKKWIFWRDEWFADLILYSPQMSETCINIPEITYVDSSNDDGLRIDLYARNFVEHPTTTFYDENAHKGTSTSFDSDSNLPYRYGFELSEDEQFTELIPLGDKKRIGDEGCSWDENYGKLDGHYYMLNLTQSLTYNVTQSDAKIKPETTYWARAYVYDGKGYNYSRPVSFTTGQYSRIDNVVPTDIRNKMDPYITIYDGNNPPFIEGEYLISPMELTYNSVGDYAVGSIFADNYIKFDNQNMHSNTLDYKAKQVATNVISETTGKGAFISGEGNNFSVFFNTTGISYYSDYDVSTKTALVISGTKGEDGIHNLQYAFVMVEKSDDPKPHVMPVGSFRVFKDGDNISEFTTWSAAKRKMQKRRISYPSIFDRRKK